LDEHQESTYFGQNSTLLPRESNPFTNKLFLQSTQLKTNNEPVKYYKDLHSTQYINKLPNKQIRCLTQHEDEDS